MKDLLSNLTNRVVGTIGDAAKAGAAIDALLKAGFDREDIDILHSEEDLKRLDPTGAEHGFLMQFHRTLIRAFDLEEFKHLTHYVEDVRAGRFVIMVRPKKRPLTTVAADILHHYGAGFVGFYGRWSCAELPATEQRAPEDIPALFARAWNERDPDALASLFDEAAQFVNVTGACWYDRKSIRTGHADGLEHAFKKSILSIEETKVKLLSSEIAVVHARMTLSGQDGAGPAGRPEPRTTVVSFVVHRAGQIWQCASAQATDVIPHMGTSAVSDAAIAGVTNYQSGQAS